MSTACRDRFFDTATVPGVVTGEGEGAKQSFKDECDINRIMARYVKTGVIDHVAMHEARYGAFDGGLSYHECLNKVREIESMFMDLPAEVRQQFANDAGAFLEFVQDPKNVERMRSMGLIDELDGVKLEAPKAPVAAVEAPAAPVAT